MNELKRLYSIKTLFLIAAAVIINMGLFMLSCNSDKDITLTGEELKSYISEYPDFLKNTKKNSENMSVLNMYKTGFAADNVRKTAKAYSKLDRIKVEYGENRGVVTLLQYSLTDIILLAFIMIMSLQLLSERKKGLVNLIRSTRHGRGRLYLQRVVILGLSALAMGILFYGGNLIGMLIKFGSGDMSRTVQSLPEFKQCTYSLTIGGYFMLSCLLKIAACYMSALAFFLIISLLGTAAAYAITAVLAVTEILLFVVIPPVSSLNMLKFINITAIIKCIDFLSVCRNLNIFGTAVSALKCNGLFMLFAIILLLAAGYVIHGKMYVKKKKPFEKLLNKLSLAFEKIAFQKTLFGWESFKLLLKQGGLFFMAAAFILALSSSMKYPTVYNINIFEKSYYEKYEGLITRKTLVKAKNELKGIDNKIEFYQKSIDELMAKGEEFLAKKQETERLNRLISAQNEFKFKKEALLPVIKDMHNGYQYTKKNMRRINLIKPYTYDLLLNKDTQTTRQASLYILIGIIGAVSGIFAYDRQNNMKNTLQSSYRGRRTLTAAKIGCVFTVCVIVSTAIHLIQIVQVGKLLGYNDLDAPVQSLMFMRDFKPYISIMNYLILLLAVRAAAAFFIGLICMAVSRFCADTMSAMGVSIFMLAVPSVFSEMISENSVISCVYLLSGNFFKNMSA